MGYLDVRMSADFYPEDGTLRLMFNGDEGQGRELLDCLIVPGDFDLVSPAAAIATRPGETPHSYVILPTRQLILTKVAAWLGTSHGLRSDGWRPQSSLRSLAATCW
jgi:hypothetical protein